MKLSLRIGAASAFTLISFLVAPSPGRAECFGTSGANTCSVFHPETSSSIVDTGGFAGTATAPFTQAKVIFATNGQWTTPFTITGITLKGDGIATSLDFGDLTITPSMNWNTNGTVYKNLTSDPSIGFVNFANNLLSFTIPANVANTSGNFSSISARIVYTDGDSMIMSLVASRVQSTAITAVPSPLPLLGVSSAFAFSRRLRRRMRQTI